MCKVTLDIPACGDYPQSEFHFLCCDTVRSLSVKDMQDISSTPRDSDPDEGRMRISAKKKLKRMTPDCYDTCVALPWLLKDCRHLFDSTNVRVTNPPGWLICHGVHFFGPIYLFSRNGV